MILRCRACAHQDHKHCEGTPEQGTCHCRQCWTRHILDWFRRTENTNDSGTLRAVRDALYALQFQTTAQRQRQAARNPAVLTCAGWAHSSRCGGARR
jgi:hypothetical protein